MDLEKLKQMIEILEKSELHKISIREKNGCEVHLEKPPVAGMAPVVHHAPHHHEVAKPAAHTAPAPAKEAEKPGDYITSPMVGTFYASPSPKDDHFVKVGDTVTADSVVCIIEAMKVMNEVKAGKAGVIKEIMIDDAHAIEFGTKLFRIE
ncbi:MAG: acetyl-CoA carboxylase biotin carboxyl carrier protein [Simkaniaceae bacterium]|nr:acetyl-CoA carboxylase biotin carboxyl carrier protein [Simkaniaceae bacterium]